MIIAIFEALAQLIVDGVFALFHSRGGRWVLFVLFLLCAVLVAGHYAYADEACPPEKPHARKMVDFTATVTCNANLNLRLMCPKETAAVMGMQLPTSTDPNLCYYVNDQTCSDIPVRKICLSDSELREAQK